MEKFFPFHLRRSRVGRDPAFTFDRFSAALAGHPQFKELKRVGKLRLFALLAETAKEYSAFRTNRGALPLAAVRNELLRLQKIFAKVAAVAGEIEKGENDTAEWALIAMRRKLLERAGEDAHAPLLPGDAAMGALREFFTEARMRRDLAAEARADLDGIPQPQEPSRGEWLRADRLPKIYERVFKMKCRNGLNRDLDAGPGNEFVRRAEALITGNAAPEPIAVKKTRTRARQKEPLS